MSEEQLGEAANRIHGVIQDCMAEGLITGAMLMDWYLVGQWMDDDGESGSLILSPDTATPHKSLGLLHLAVISLEEDIRDWLRDGED